MFFVNLNKTLSYCSKLILIKNKMEPLQRIISNNKVAEDLVKSLKDEVSFLTFSIFTSPIE